MSQSNELRVYNSNTGITHLTGGFNGSLKNKSDVESIIKTFRNLSRLVPDVSESTTWDDVAHYQGCMFVAALEEMSKGSNGLMNAFVINRLCSVVKENLAPTYVKGTNRFQQNLDAFRSQGFKEVRERLHDKVNLGSQVLEEEYPARINIDWLASAAASLNDLPLEFYDFQRQKLFGLGEMCSESLLKRWLTISDSPTDLLVTLGVEDALNNAHHVVTDSDHFGSFLTNLRSLLTDLLADIPYSNIDLFDAEMDDDTFDEEDDEDSFDVIEEGSDIDEDEGEDELDDDDLEEEDEDDSDDGEEDEDESLSTLFTGDDESDLNDELDEEEYDEEEDDEDEGNGEGVGSSDNPVAVYHLLAMAVGHESMDKCIRDYVNMNVDGMHVDEDFSPMSNVIMNSGMTSTEVCEAFVKDFVGVEHSSAWNLISVIGSHKAFADRVLNEIGLAVKYESMSDVFDLENEESKLMLPIVVDAIAKNLLTTDFLIEVRGLSEEDRRELLNSVQGEDVTDYEMPKVMEMLHNVAPQKLFEGLISMHNKTSGVVAEEDVMVGREVRELTATIIETLGKATLSQNVDYRIDLNDLCEAVDNFDLPLDPTFRHFLLESIKEMLTETYGEVIVNSQFDLRGVFFKFIAVELDTKNTQTISLLEILTSQDDEVSEPEDSSAVVQDDEAEAESEFEEEAASDENYALKP